MGRFEYQCGQDRMGKVPLVEGRNRDLWQDSGFDGEAEGRVVVGEGGICHLLPVPPAPLSCILPWGGKKKKKNTLMSE